MNRRPNELIAARYAYPCDAASETPNSAHERFSRRTSFAEVIAITAGNYGKEDQWIPPTRVLREFLEISFIVLGLAVWS
jgi:hypothetical protein